MAVSIVPRFSAAQVKAMMQERVNRIETAVLRRLQRIGEEFVRNARIGGAYKDQTGNLRSSVGYVVLRNGETVNSSFPGAKAKGKSEARKVISEAAAQYNTGWVLIVVAGMDYAAYVESKGYDVLSASGEIAKADIRKAVENIRKTLEK